MSATLRRVVWTQAVWDWVRERGVIRDLLRCGWTADCDGVMVVFVADGTGTEVEDVELVVLAVGLTVASAAE